MIKILVIGAGGQMGREVIKAAQEVANLEIAGGVERKDHPLFGKEILGVKVGAIEGFGDQFECAVDFSTPETTISSLDFLATRKTPVVIGTTGFTDEQMELIEEKAREIAIFIAPNMAYGINVLINWIDSLVKNLEEFDIELSEIHHRRKKDAPSGTALRIVDKLKEVRSNLDEVYGRKGKCGPRRDNELGIAAIRGGDVYGVHNLYLLGPGEEIQISHRAISRAAFAFGALKAVNFIITVPPGIYNMEHLIV